MAKIRLSSTEVQLWHELVKDAEEQYRYQFTEEIEQYLVMLLQNFMDKPELSSSVISVDYLKGQQHPAWRERQTLLREVGDKCLLFSGFFPEIVIKRNVSVSYLVDVGRAAYQGVSDSANNEQLISDLFYQLREEFVSLMDVLQCIREMRGIKHQLPPMLAEELWRKVRSRHAREILMQWTKKE